MKKRWTLNEVVALNITLLREARRWTATELAESLTTVLERTYTRFSVADLEGRREREIRWVELAALCSIFNVALWDLVLPPKGVEVDSLVATGAITGAELFDSPSDDPDLAAIGAVQGIVWHEYPTRDDLSWRFFSLEGKRMENDLARHRAEVDEILPLLRREWGRPSPNKTDEKDDYE